MNDFNKKLVEKVESLRDYLIEQRRYLHENPELTSKEFETSKYLKAEVSKLGLPITEVKGTGFYAVLDTGREGKVLGIRTDIDALPVLENENNLKGPRVCRSKVDGVMHACGHDGHMAMVLTTAKALVDMKDEFSGKIVFIFEEGEEAGTGIFAMLDGLKEIPFDAIYGTHLAAFMDVGKISVSPGPVMAGAAGIRIVVRGRGGHGSRPDLAISPIFAGANILTNLASAWANQMDVTKTATLGIGAFNSGSVGNVIPDEAKIEGSVRFFDIEEGQKAVDVIKKVATLTAEAHNCTATLDEERNIVLGNPVINDAKLSELATNGIEEIFPGAIQTDVVWFASESFNFYNTLCPSLFAFVGVRNEEYGSGADHHNEYFDMDEKGLYYGTVATLKFAYEFLNK